MEITVPRDRVSREPIPWKEFWLNEIIQRTKWTQLTGEPGFRVGRKSGQDFVIVDSEGQMSDVMDDWSVRFGRCRGGHYSQRFRVGSFVIADEWPELEMIIQVVSITSGIMAVEVPEVARHWSCSGCQICQILRGSKRRVIRLL